MRATAFAVLLALTVTTDGVAGDAPRAIDAIENDLVADDPAVRAKAAAELADRFPDGAALVPMLAGLLDDEDAAVVAAAARTLDSMSVAGAMVLAAASANRALLGAKAPYDEDFSAVVAGYFIAPTDALAEDAPVTASACLHAALLAPGSRSDEWLPKWELSLLGAHRRGKDDARPLAAAGLAMLGADVLAARAIGPSADARRAAAAEALVPLVASDDVLESWCGARIAARLRTGTPELAAALTETLVAVKPAPELWRTVTHDRRETGWLPVRFDRLAAVDALAALGPSAAAAAPRLAVVPSDPSIGSEWCDRDPGGFFRPCVRALVRLGREDDLRAILGKDPANADFLARTAAESGCAAAVVLPRLTARAAKADAHLDVFRGLAALGPAAASALPGLKARLASETNEWRREEMAAAIVAISPSDADAIDFLAALVKGKDLSISDNASGWVYDAWSVLCRAAPTPTVVRILADDINGRHHGSDDAETLAALGRAGPLAKDAVPGMLEFVNHEDASGSHAIAGAVALGRIGPDAAAAIPALAVLRDHGDETIRVPAAQALRRIRAKK